MELETPPPPAEGPPREVPRSGWRPQPWKNGAGITHEILRWPDSDRFDVRVSLAEDTVPATFSLFPGYVRWSFLAGDAPITLVEAGGPATTLARPGEHLRTLGETQLASQLPSGPTRVLTVLVRRALVDCGEVVVGHGPTTGAIVFSFHLPSQRAWVYGVPGPLPAADHVWIAARPSLIDPRFLDR